MKFSLTVNDCEHTLDVDPRRVLVDVLRDNLGLTGAKKSCGMGNCGSCTVLINDKAVYSCLVLAVECDGEHIATIEGLADGDDLDPVQHAFIANDAMQCGFCTPGQIMSIKELELRSARLDEAELPMQLAGNLCRCGAYGNIRAAARSVLNVNEPGDHDE